MHRPQATPPAWCSEPSHSAPRPVAYRVWVLRPSERPGRALRLAYLCEECAAPVLAALRSRGDQEVAELGLDGVPVSAFQDLPDLRLVAELYGGAI